MLGRIALYIVGACLCLGGALFVLEGFTTRFDGTSVAGLIAAGLGVAVVYAGTRLGQPQPVASAGGATATQPLLGSNAGVLLRIILAAIGVPLVLLGVVTFTERPSGPMADLAYLLGGASLFIGLAALYGAYALRRRKPN